MKAASVSEIKKELSEQATGRLVELCLRLARYKKENKELLTYLLFESDNELLYIKHINEELTEGFTEVNTGNNYFAKKTLRKLLRIANKYIRFAGSKTVEVEVLLHYCTNFKGLNMRWQKSTALVNLYKGQLKKIKTAIDSFHEDLQYDYLKEWKRLGID
jgi:hypothetical protein